MRLLTYFIFLWFSQAGDVPEVSLNFSALAAESPFEREVIEGCIRETLMLLLRAVASQRSVLFTFRGIGVLVFRNLKVKMHFYKDFVTNMDGSGKALWALSNVSLNIFIGYYCTLLLLSLSDLD